MDLKAEGPAALYFMCCALYTTAKIVATVWGWVFG